MIRNKISSDLPSIYVVYWFEPYLWSQFSKRLPKLFSERLKGPPFAIFATKELIGFG